MGGKKGTMSKDRTNRWRSNGSCWFTQFLGLLAHGCALALPVCCRPILGVAVRAFYPSFSPARLSPWGITLDHCIVRRDRHFNLIIVKDVWNRIEFECVDVYWATVGWELGAPPILMPTYFGPQTIEWGSNRRQRWGASYPVLLLSEYPGTNAYCPSGPSEILGHVLGRWVPHLPPSFKLADSNVLKSHHTMRTPVATALRTALQYPNPAALYSLRSCSVKALVGRALGDDKVEIFV